MSHEDLLSILICPETKQPLYPAPASLIDDMNLKIRSGLIKNKAGATPREISGGYICENGAHLYPVVSGIPILIMNQAIPLHSL